MRRATVASNGATKSDPISIHALLAESDDTGLRQDRPAEKFLSTLSLRRATLSICVIELIEHFYPRSPCGERRALACSAGLERLFLSTLSLRRATPLIFNVQPRKTISIHALLAESDSRRYPAIPGNAISIHALLAESDQRAEFCGRS